MALDAKTWLLEEGYDEATAAELAPKMAANPEAVARIEASIMRQSDYSREKDALARSQADLAAANDRLNLEYAEWGAAQQQGGQVTAKMQRDLEAAQARVATLTTRVQTYATRAGIDPTEAMAGLETVVPQNTPPPQASAFDHEKFTADQNGRYAQLARLSVTLPAELFNIATEHQELYGKPLDTVAISNEIINRSQTRGNQKSLNPRDVWEEMHKVPDRRAEVSKAKYDADIKAAEDRGRQAAISEAVIPGQPAAPGSHSPLFAGGRKSVLERPQPGSSVNAAVTAFRSGKYKPQGGPAR